ncbi:Talin-2 [Hypsibius exemplaris]|uniref:Talin-2 n=1 Tax=Hypsibius exemplaris TaxID=2072580 RepID=A0A1W0WZD0_HYPEX|nr:Talin-2 [Hypsibius exemplaris]
MPQLLQLNVIVNTPGTLTRRPYRLDDVKAETLVGEVTRRIWEMSPVPMSPTSQFPAAQTPTKVNDYGIFLQNTSGNSESKGHWLNPNNSLEHYAISNGSMLEFKARKRMMKIQLQDQSVKSLIIDQSQPVQLLLPFICEKMGISNHDEFDLVRVSNEQNGDQVDTGTLPKKAGLTARLVDPSNYNPATLDTRRMVRLKKKLATEDDVVWVNQAQTLDEQGITESDVLLLRRRYFFSDRNVDVRDPVQLNLLYVQCRSAILSGSHPVTLREAFQFAGVQGQVEYQDYDESKRNVDVRSFLPRNLNGSKKLDKKQLEEYHGQVQVQWQMHRGLSDLDAKDLYIRMARSLKTYGITFFLVKEKKKGKNKLVPRLFGVTRSAVLRLDEKTKETLESRPLEQVLKWAVTGNTFSLSFGDYTDDLWSIQTTEGTQIAQLIFGYVELIRKRQRRDSDTNNRYTDTIYSNSSSGDSQVASYEEIDDAKRGQIGNGSVLVNRHQVHSGQVAMPGVLRDTYADKHDVHYIGVAHARVAQIIANFAAPFQLPQSSYAQAAGKMNITKEEEYTMEEYQKAFATSMGQVSASVAHLINISRSNTPDQKENRSGMTHADQQNAINDLINGLDELARSLRHIAPTTSHEESTNLMMSGQAFCQSFSNLLNAADPAGRTEGSAESRQAILMAVAQIGETGRHLAQSVSSLRPQSPGNATLSDRHNGDFIVFTKQIGSGMTDIVRKAKLLASEVPEPEVQRQIIHHATELALQSAEIIATAKLLRLCAKEEPETARKTTEQLLLALEALQRALDTLQDVSHGGSDGRNMTEMGQHYVFEIDEGAVIMSELLDNFKRALGDSVKPRNDAVLNALFLLNHRMRELDSRMMGNIETTKNDDFTITSDFHDRLVTDVTQLKLCLTESDLTKQKKSETDTTALDHLLGLLQSLMDDTMASNAAGHWQTEDERVSVMNYLKTIHETAYQFVSETASSGQFDGTARDAFIEAVDEFAAVLEAMQENKAILQETLADIQTSLARVDEQLKCEVADVPSSFNGQSTPSRKVSSRAAMAEAICRLEAISEALEEMISQLKNINPDVSYYPEALRELAGSLCSAYRRACNNWADFHASGSELVDEVAKRHIHQGLVELGHSCTALMYAAVASSTDLTASAFPAACKDVRDKISRVQLYLNTLNCGSQSCGRALSTIEEVAEDLETAIIFAEAGGDQFDNSTPSTPTTPRFPTNIPQPKKSFDLSHLIAHLQSCLRQFEQIKTQQQLATAVEDTLRDTVEMVDTVRSTTAHLAQESPEAQVVALRSLRMAALAVAEAIRRLKTKFGQGKVDGSSDEGWSDGSVEAAVMVASDRVDRLVEVVSAAEYPMETRGKRLLQTMVHGLVLQLKDTSDISGDAGVSEGPPNTNAAVANLEDLSIVAGKLEQAIQSGRQEDHLEAASYISQYSAAILLLRKGATTANQHTNHQTAKATASIDGNSESSLCLSSFTIYLETVVQVLSSSKQQSSWDHPEMAAARGAFHAAMAEFEARRTARTRTESDLSQTNGELPLLQVRDHDVPLSPNHVLDGLSEAAAKIDEATRKLNKVQARRTIYIAAEIPLTDFDNSEDFHDPVFEFDENVLDACKAIMAASAGLIPAAGKAQDELVKFGRVRVRSDRYSEDGQWSQGFISAAQAIGGACQTLCDAAHALMMGHATEEKLISAAKQVASFTAQLLLACRVRGDTNSPTMKRLLLAGNVVRRSTDQLVQVFLRRRQEESPDSRGSPEAPLLDVVVNKKLVGGIAQEIKANEQVLKRERELVDAQKHLLVCRKAKYADRRAGLQSPASQPSVNPVMDELNAQEQVLIKERELQEARNALLALRQIKYGENTTPDEYSGYGATPTGTLNRRKTAN